MGLFQLIPVVLSLLMLGAHFLRSANYLLLGGCLLLILLLLVQRPISARIVQIALVLGAVEWVHTAYVFVAVRSAHGMPWTRLAVILGAVSLFTLASALVFHTKTLRARYGRAK